MFAYEPGFYMPVQQAYEQPAMQYHAFAAHEMTPHPEYEGYVLVNPTQGNGWLSESYDYHPNKVPRFSTPVLPSATTPPRAPAIPISPVSFVTRQKFKRTATACEECRKKKQKCDGEDPCQACKDQNIKCQYREVPIRKKDQGPERLMQLMEHLHKQIAMLNDRIVEMRTMLDEQDRRLMMQTQHWHRNNNNNGNVQEVCA
ncbi:hypothetical protein PRZ48_012243 [Zasmidium cellare]|uniref:Zn(2)-C6 fungal-type domain-containing protein n=1 Tax=Zasmidium cellare TaxID=395010 RepID=A0ABR0E4D0_ZASCE|nr:hypothetical protein PRZ48_012243 [Zasmidium cellare]